MTLERIKKNLERGYTMAIYGTKENLYNSMLRDIKHLVAGLESKATFVVKHNDEVVATANSVSGALQAMKHLFWCDFEITDELSSTRYQLTDRDTGTEVEMELINVEHYD